MRVTLAMPLVPKPKKSDIVSTLNGAVTNLSIEKAFGNERLEGANLQINTEKHVTTARGDGKLFGANATIAMKQAAGEPGEVQVQFIADDAVRAKRGFAAIPGLKGGVGVTVKTAAQKTTPFDMAAVSLDLPKASIDGLGPGWTKAAGKPAAKKTAAAKAPTGKSAAKSAGSKPVAKQAPAGKSTGKAPAKKAPIKTVKVNAAPAKKAAAKTAAKPA
eukprot:gene65805-90035_t